MSRGYVLSAPALHDLDAILEYAYVDGGSGAVRALIARFHEAFARLAAFPHIGHVSEYLQVGNCRIWTVYDYLVVYNPESSPLEVVRIVHGAQRPSIVSGTAP